MHAIDCGSGALLPLVAMPHCGAVVTRDQLDRVERLLTRLRAEVGRRQQLLAEAGHASLAELRAARQATGCRGWCSCSTGGRGSSPRSRATTTAA